MEKEELHLYYDVIIVGGGPLGSIASSLIAQDGFKVLLIEKQKHPRWKPCGEGISAKGVQLLKQFGFYRPVQNILWKITGASINIIQENIAIQKYDKPVAHTLNRARFDHELFKFAQETGAETHEAEKVIDINALGKDKISVKTTKQDYNSRMIIGADGVYSLVGRKVFRQWKKDEVTPCQVARYRISKKHHFRSETMEYYFIQGGYGWVFPRVENEYLILNIGIGKIGGRGDNLTASFDNFIESLENKKKIKFKGKKIGGKIWTHLIPAQGPSRGTYSDRCLLIGDAGGFVNPLTGAGLHYGLLSTIYASEIAIKFLDNKIESLKPYEDKWQKNIKPIFDKSFEVREKLYLISPPQLLKKIQEYPELKEKLFQSFAGKSSKK